MHRGSHSNQRTRLDTDSPAESPPSNSFSRTLDLARGKPIYRVLFIIYILFVTFVIASLTDYSQPSQLDIDKYFRKVPFVHLKPFKYDSSARIWKQQVIMNYVVTSSRKKSLR